MSVLGWVSAGLKAVSSIMGRGGGGGGGQQQQGYRPDPMRHVYGSRAKADKAAAAGYVTPRTPKNIDTREPDVHPAIELVKHAIASSNVNGVQLAKAARYTSDLHGDTWKADPYGKFGGQTLPGKIPTTMA